MSAHRRFKTGHVLTKIGLERGNEFEWEGAPCVWFQKNLSR